MPSSDQGVQPSRYSLIPRTLIFLTRGDKVLLIKGAATKRLWANRYNGIGGHVECGEDVLTAARRELAEETGLSALVLALCGTITIDTGRNPGIVLFVLRGECPSGEPVPSPEGSPEWVKTTEAISLPLVEDLETLLPVVLAWRPEHGPFSAHYDYDEQDRLRIRFGS